LFNAIRESDNTTRPKISFYRLSLKIQKEITDDSEAEISFGNRNIPQARTAQRPTTDRFKPHR
jgi:hypothetical protein